MEINTSPEQYRFKKFYEQLSYKQGIIFIFFTSGLLFFLRKALCNISKSIKIILLGAGLLEIEVNWVLDHYAYPFYIFEKYIDDRFVWELLFNTCSSDFGWLDVDCFIKNPDLLNELCDIDTNTAVNTVWSFKSEYISQIEFINTYLVYVNVFVLQQVRNSINPSLSPSVYIYPEDPPFTYAEYKIINPEQSWGIDEIISKRLHSYRYFFDTLHFYQIVATGQGYLCEKKRNLINHVNGLENYFSNEIIHIGSSCYFSPDWSKKNEIIFRYETYDNIYENFWNLLIIYHLMKNSLDKLPRIYKTMFSYYQRIVFGKINIDWDNSIEKLSCFFNRFCIKQEMIEFLIKE